MSELTMTSSDLDRFLDKIEIDDKTNCWLWQANRTFDDYGVFWLIDKNVRAHRVSYEYFYGEIPEGQCVLHSCDNPSCVNPEHLFLGTNQDNTDDMIEKGRNNFIGRPCVDFCKKDNLTVSTAIPSVVCHSIEELLFA